LTQVNWPIGCEQGLVDLSQHDLETRR